jgi:hypothetical protein
MHPLMTTVSSIIKPELRYPLQEVLLAAAVINKYAGSPDSALVCELEAIWPCWTVGRSHIIYFPRT